MNVDLYAKIVTRAASRCECGCGARVPPGELDHFFGRAKVEESEGNCWILTPACHFSKTNNAPSAREWLTRFIAFAERHGYVEALVRAESKRMYLKTKHDLTADMRRRNA